MAVSQKEIEKLHSLYSARSILQSQITDLAQLEYRYISAKADLLDLQIDLDQEIVESMDDMIKDLQSKRSITEEHLELIRSEIAEIEERLH